MINHKRLTVVASFVLSACGGHGTSDQHGGSTESDTSALVQATPVLVIPNDSGNGQPWFLRVAGATRLSSGAIIVLDEYRPGILFFDSSGRFMRAVGRRGSGPNEFEFPA